MEIDNKYITVAYRLFTIEEGLEDKEPMEECNEIHPFQFISKLGLVLPKFEENVADLNTGDAFDFTIKCEDAYGDFSDELMFDVDANIFKVDGKIDTNHVYEGAVVPMQGEDGSRFNATIIQIKQDKVTIDLNHPRAGQDLHFVGKVVESRLATNEEISETLNSLGESGGCGGGCGNCGDGGCEGGCGGGCHC
ncbi:MAG: peptidylprolyl isomerase [Bacteroidales bacterium]|nr:peptidylprolyl isomerase [Bacteroidales bacterium]